MELITYNPFVYPFIEPNVYEGAVTHPFGRTLVQPAMWDEYNQGDPDYYIPLKGFKNVNLTYTENFVQYNYTNIQYTYYNFDFENALSYLNQSTYAHITWQINNEQYALAIGSGKENTNTTYPYMNLEWNSTEGCYMALETSQNAFTVVTQRGTETSVLNNASITYARAKDESLGYARLLKFDDTTYIKGVYRLGGGYNWSNLDDFGDSYYQQGVTDGIREASVELSPFEYMRQAGTAIADIFGMQIFPGVTLGTIMAVPVIGALIIVMVKILRR